MDHNTSSWTFCPCLCAVTDPKLRLCGTTCGAMPARLRQDSKDSAAAVHWRCRPSESCNPARSRLEGHARTPMMQRMPSVSKTPPRPRRCQMLASDRPVCRLQEPTGRQGRNHKQAEIIGGSRRMARDVFAGSHALPRALPPPSTSFCGSWTTT